MSFYLTCVSRPDGQKWQHLRFMKIMCLIPNLNLNSIFMDIYMLQTQIDPAAKICYPFFFFTKSPPKKNNFSQTYWSKIHRFSPALPHLENERRVPSTCAVVHDVLRCFPALHATSFSVRFYSFISVSYKASIRTPSS